MADEIKYVSQDNLDTVLGLLKDEFDTHAPLESPELTGTPKAPTAAAGTKDTQIATTAFVDSAVSGAIAGVTQIGFDGPYDSLAALEAAVAEPEAGTIYLVKNGGPAGNVCDEYFYREGQEGSLLVTSTTSPAGEQVFIKNSDWPLTERTKIGFELVAQEDGELSDGGIINIIFMDPETTTYQSNLVFKSEFKLGTGEVKAIIGSDAAAGDSIRYIDGDNVTYVKASGEEYDISGALKEITSGASSDFYYDPTYGIDYANEECQGMVVQTSLAMYKWTVSAIWQGEGGFELFGTTQADLSGYVKTEDVAAMTEAEVNAAWEAVFGS